MHWRVTATPNPIARLILAHGAGAGMDSPFMQDVATELSRLHIECVLLEFSYMQRQQTTGKKCPPSPAKQLLSEWQSAYTALNDTDKPLFIGGKSMGGRLASMLADTLNPSGLICLGYPFHPPKQPEKLRLVHLADIKTPTLIIQGTRDPFAQAPAVHAFDYSPALQLHWLAEGGHSFETLKRAPHTQSQLIMQACQQIATFVNSVII